MTIKMKALLLCLVFAKLGVCQAINGTWKGNLNLPNKAKLPLVFHIQKIDTVLAVTMDSPAQNANGLKVDSASFINNELGIFIKLAQIRYKGTLKGDSIAGIFTQGSAMLPLILYRGSDTANQETYKRPQEPKPPFDYNISDVSFKNSKEGNLLAGTICTPKNTSDFPIVVMITGSGSQNRNEEILGHKPFLVIADYFAKHGIGSLRLDDRGVGGSEAGKDGATSADFATDINTAVEYLSKQGFKNIGLLGHSEGGMIAPMVSSTNKKVKFLVLMAGPGIPIDELMILQNKAVAKTSGMNDKQMDESLKDTKQIFEFIKSYAGNNYRQELKSRMTEILAQSGKYTAEQQTQILDQQLAALSSPWFLYFLKFDPDVYLSKTTVPVLAINGEKDVQVTAKENLEGIQKSLQKAGNKNFKTLPLPGLNHLFQKAETGSVAEYATIEQTIQPEVLAIMADWIIKLRK
ncbi:MAG: alpha/beta hydrolase [Agriterribacter sp.]